MPRPRRERPTRTSVAEPIEPDRAALEPSQLEPVRERRERPARASLAEPIEADRAPVEPDHLEPNHLEPNHLEPVRERRERARPEGAPLRRQRSPRGSTTFSEDGFSYEVRDVSAGDLAALREPPAVPAAPAVSSGAVLDMAAPAPDTTLLNNWDGPVDEAFVNVGREDGVRTSDLHQALSTAGVSQGDTAYVRIRQKHTFIGVRQGLLDRVVSGLSGQKIAQRLVEAQPARPRQARR
jgi:hypothetical protein